MDWGKESKDLFISFDCEGPFGMYEFINSFKDLSRYESLDRAIKFLHDYHTVKELPVTFGILIMTLLDNKKELNYYLEKYHFNNSNNLSLIKKITQDSKFIELIDENPEYFFKGELIKNLSKLNSNFIKYCSHTFSHIHFTELNIPIHEIELDIKISKIILEKVFEKDQICNSIILPRNQHNKNLIKICKKYNFKSLRISSQLKLYSENNNKIFLKRFFYKFLRKYDQNSLPFSNILQNFNNYNQYINSNNESIKLIDSGIFIPFPSKKNQIRPYIKSIKRYLYKSIKNDNNISIWFHPHNLLNNFELSKDYYDEVISSILNITKFTHKPKFLDE